MGGDTVEAFTILQSAAPGMAMHQVHHFAGERRPEIVWLFRCSSAMIQSLLKECSIEVRAGSIEVDDICLIPVLFCLNDRPTEDRIYETWINVNQMGENPLTFLAVQSRIIIQLFGDSGQIEKSLEIKNPLQPLANTLLLQLGNEARWSVSQFEAALQKSYRQFPTVVDLWNELPRLLS
jgi:hypothetical protein